MAIIHSTLSPFFPSALSSSFISEGIVEWHSGEKPSIPPDVWPAIESWDTAFSWRNSSHPWIPIGKVGPLLIIAHSAPATPKPIPRWLAGLVKISEEHYKSLFDEFRINTNDRNRPAEGIEEKHPPFPEVSTVIEAANEIIKIPQIDEVSKAQLRAIIIRKEEELPANDSAPALCLVMGGNQLPLAAMDIRNCPLDKTAIAKAGKVFAEKNALPLKISNDHALIAVQFDPRTKANKSALFALSDQLSNEQVNLPANCHYVMAGPEQIKARLKEIARHESSISRPHQPSQSSVAIQSVRLSIDTRDTRKIDPHRSNTSNEEIVEWLLGQVVLLEAQDLHCDFIDGEGRFRISIDGVLREVLRVNSDQWSSLNGIIRDMAHCAKEKFECESKRFTIRVDSLMADFRLEATTFRDGTFPPALTLRYLPRTIKKRILTDLGLRDEYINYLRNYIAHEKGLFLVTGPTGSGKTTTLYSCINELNHPSRKIVTAEDPIEQIIEGAVQSEVHPSRGVTFATLLRSFVRSAPRVILVGEIRDHETASLATDASMTGHLVLSTLHTNDAAGAISRLYGSFGIDRGFVSDNLIASSAQRLLRTLCKECREHKTIPSKLRLEFEARGIPAPRVIYSRSSHGCNACFHEGLRGRTCIMEFIPNTDEISAMIHTGRTDREINRRAQSLGFPLLAGEALIKVAEGQIDLREARPYIHTLNLD